MSKTVEQIKAEYAPYNNHPMFERGYDDYMGNHKYLAFTGVQAQAYDRGMEAAMRVQREG